MPTPVCGDLTFVARLFRNFHRRFDRSTRQRRSRVVLMRAVAGAVAASLFFFAAAGFAAADMNKTLFVSFEAPETGFDPAAVSDHYSLEVISNILEPLLTYDYLARPQKLVPGTATLPQISDGG